MITFPFVYNFLPRVNNCLFFLFLAYLFIYPPDLNSFITLDSRVNLLNYTYVSSKLSAPSAPLSLLLSLFLQTATLWSSLTFCSNWIGCFLGLTHHSCLGVFLASFMILFPISYISFSLFSIV